MHYWVYYDFYPIFYEADVMLELRVEKKQQ